MARINKNGTLSGLMGDVVLRSCGGKTFVHKRPDEFRNPQTQGQMMQRTKKQNIVNLYGSMKPALRDNFQDKVGRQSDYSMFVSCNLSQQSVHLDKYEGSVARGAVVAPYIVSFGKLPSVEYSLEGEWLVSNIQVGTFQLTSDTMMFDFASSVLSNNPDWKEGDVLELISCKQIIRKFFSDRPAVPYAECVYANLVLDPSDRSRLNKYLDGIELKVNEDGFLCVHASEEGGYAIVRKRNSSRGVITGIQTMAVHNGAFDQYSTDEQIAKSIESYQDKKKRR